MNKLFIRHDDSHSLIIIFLGWGFEPNSFSNLRKSGSNILILSQYNGLSGAEIDREITDFVKHEWKSFESDCSEVIVIGWSFGVKIAASFLEITELPITLCLAVNGTEHHIDDIRGIPKAIFDGTLDGLSERSFEKFRLRCAGSRDLLNSLIGDVKSTTTSVEDLRSELEWFATLTPSPSERQLPIWDKVVVGMNDRIFPPQNQIASWNGFDLFQVDGMSHIPDFQWLIDSFIVSKRKVGDKFTIAGDSYSEHAQSQRATAKKLYDLFSDLFEKSQLRNSDKFRDGKLSVLELGFGDGMFTDFYFNSIKESSELITLSDIRCSDVAVARKYSSQIGADHLVEFVYGDAESVAFLRKILVKGSRDIIFSSSMFQWLNSPRNLLKNCSCALKKDGMIALSYYGPGTFKEIQETIGAGLKYPSLQWMQRIALGCGLRVDVAETDQITMLFDSPTEALRHLKLTGVNALDESSSHKQTRYLLNNWPLDESGKAKLTFCPVYLILSKN